MTIRLQRVHFIPEELEPRVLYISEEYAAAAHLCPCGCGSRVSTPLGPTDWSLEETQAGPTLDPSVGNWHLPCKSHYWITQGRVVWARRWGQMEIEAGRRREAARAREYYGQLDLKRSRPIPRLRRWIQRLLRRGTA